MKINFRLECPHCEWGVQWRDAYVNQGWVKLKCTHCDEDFYTKISIPTVDIKTSKIQPRYSLLKDGIIVEKYGELDEDRDAV